MNDLARKARSMLAKRAALVRHIHPALCVDPAVDLLLFLFAEVEEGKRTTTAACCDAVRAPRTTALRWIGRLEDHGLVKSADDPDDRRVTLLRLTDAGQAALRAWMSEIESS